MSPSADRSSLWLSRLFVLLPLLALLLVASACGGEGEPAAAPTVDETQAPPAAEASIVSVQLGEDGSKYFVKLDKSSVVAGTSTFTIDNVGTTHHELAFFRTDLAADKLPLNADDEVELPEEAEVGEAVYATPLRGDPDHRIRDGRGIDYSIKLDAGAYVLLCNLSGHYKAGQFAAFTVEEATADSPAPAEPEPVESPAADPADGTPVSVQLGDDGSKYFVKLDTPSVAAGKVTFKIDNVGTTHHELAIYKSDLAPGKLPLDADGKAVVEEADVKEAVYVTPLRGDPDHRIRDGRGVDYTVELEPGAYILLCNLTGHYKGGQYTAFKVT